MQQTAQTTQGTSNIHYLFCNQMLQLVAQFFAPTIQERSLIKVDIYYSERFAGYTAMHNGSSCSNIVRALTL
jgi:hypothetical protein